MLRLDDLGDAFDNPKCCICAVSLQLDTGEIFRCLDCKASSLWCSQCLVSSHRRQYLHRVEVRMTNCFVRTNLKSLGLRVQLGHADLESCPKPIAAFDDNFTIIDTSGIHHVGLDFCGCYRGITRTRQCLRERLFPSTNIDPRTACTFRVLQHFQMSSFTQKSSAYEYLVCLYRLTDNTWILTPQGRAESCGAIPLAVCPSQSRLHNIILTIRATRIVTRNSCE